MPNRDGTGPQGKGPITGAKMGSCSTPYGQGKNGPFKDGRGPRCEQGQRRGLGNRWSNAVEKPEEKGNIAE